jgi:hypothetical protein
MNMLVEVHQSVEAVFYNVREKKVVKSKSSTYKQRVITDRIVMALMMLGAVTYAVISA